MGLKETNNGVSIVLKRQEMLVAWEVPPRDWLALNID